MSKTVTPVPVYHSFPPNFDDIAAALKFRQKNFNPSNCVYTYGEGIYVPSGRELPADIVRHEMVHIRQQKVEGVDNWWRKYLEDPEFRLAQELEAYGVQAAFFKPLGEKVFMRQLQRLSYDLSSPAYGNIISFWDAQVKILAYVKKVSR